MTSPVPNGSLTIKTVSNASQLIAALQTASGETEIRLKPGSYGWVGVTNINPLAHITVTSESATQHAAIDMLQFRGSSNMTFSELTLNHIPVNPLDGSGNAYVSASHDITFLHDEFFSAVDNNVNNDGGGLEIVNSSRISVLDSKFHDLRWSVFAHESDHLVVAGNDVRWVREGFDFAGDNYVTIDGNLFTGFHPQLDGPNPDHPDAIQFWTSASTGSHHVEITNNAMLFAGSQPIEGIFITEQGNTAAGRHSDFTIADNIYYGQSRHGITAMQVDGLRITENTVLSSPKYNSVYQYLDPAIWTANTTNAHVDHNISSLMVSENDVGRTADHNIDAWDMATGVGTSYATLYHHEPGSGSPPAWFVAQPGTVAATQHIGYDNVAAAGNWANVTQPAVDFYHAELDHAGANIFYA